MMARLRIQPLIDWLKRAVTQPADELDRWEKATRFAYDLGRYGAKQLREDRAPQMAAALSFRTLFGLLPVLVVGTMLVKAFGGFEQFRDRLGELLASLGLDQFELQAAGTGDAGAVASQSLSDWLLDLISQAQDINIAAITWIGIVVLIYSAVSLVVTIEGCFNSICRAPEGRPWLQRFLVYWAVLTLGPAAIAITSFADKRFDAFVTDVVSWSWMLKIATLMWSFLATWLLMFAIYKLMPHTKVKTRCALVGALVAAVLLEIGKRTMGLYFEHALSFRQLYGSLGLIPLFMFWVYIMWLVVLFGLEVSATLQMLTGRTLDQLEHKRRPTGLVDPAAVLTVMEVIGERFCESKTTTDREITDVTAIPETTVRTMISRLIGAGVLHRLEGEDGAVSLARPPEGINVGQLLEVGFSLADEGGSKRDSTLVQKLRETQRTLAEKATLADMQMRNSAP